MMEGEKFRQLELQYETNVNRNGLDKYDRSTVSASWRQ